MYNNKKGQAALEFLMTYGWAIMAAIIVIGALGTYFYFNQSGTDTIYIAAPFGSIASKIEGGPTNKITLDLANKGGEELSSVSIGISNGQCTSVAGGTSGVMPAGVASSQVILNCANLGSGTFQGAITINYTRPGSSIVLSTTGSLSGPVR